MINNNPLVSIILPTFNRQVLLPRAINSVLNQIYQNWEVIIWNDGSTDNTNEIIHGYSDQRIHPFSSENHGMSYALNQAIKQSKGEYVAFIDDDDQWLENKLELQVGLLSANSDIDLVFGNFQNYYENEIIPGLGFDQTARAMSALRSHSIGSDAKIITEGFLEGLARDNFIAFDSAMIRRKVIDSIGAFNQGLRNGMDLEYWWRFGLAGHKVAYTNSVVLRRYKYANSLSGRNLVSVSNHIKALDSCADLSKLAKREDAVIYLKPAYRNAWQNMITACALENDKRGMLKAFRHSLKNGFRLGSLRLLLKGMLSPKVAK